MTEEKINTYTNVIYSIIGAAYDVFKELKYGIAEAVYEEALCIELAKRGLNSQEQCDLPIYYKGILMKKKYRMDIVVENDIIIELKAVEELLPEHRAQLFNYLRLTNKPIGLLINFGKSVDTEKYQYESATNKIIVFTNKKMVNNLHQLDIYR